MVEIRRANTDDLEYMYEALDKLNEFHHSSEPDYFKPPEEVRSVKDLSRYLSFQDVFAYVACEPTEYVGFLVGSISELKSPISKPVKMGSIDEIYIEPRFRGQGIGTRFNHVVEEYCRQHGATDLFTEVWGFNEPALGYYQHIGLKTHVHLLRKKL